MNRPSWDATWIAVARAIAQRSRCVRRKACSVIVSADNRFLSAGYNGPPAGMELEGEFCDAWCPRGRGDKLTGTNDYSTCLTIHGEPNALMKCSVTERKGGTIYIVEGSPCLDCAKLVSNAGLARVVVTPPLPQDVDRVHLALDFMRRSGLEVIEFA